MPSRHRPAHADRQIPMKPTTAEIETLLAATAKAWALPATSGREALDAASAWQAVATALNAEVR